MAETTTSRGYGATHQRERRRWQTIVDTGNATCARCRQPIPPGTPWDLDHTDDRTGYRGPAHRYCNRSAGGRNGAHKANQHRQRTSRNW